MARKKEDLPYLIAVIYARYSSHSQNDASIEQQVEECQEYARLNNLHVVNVYADRALSGKNDRRPEFQKMMRAAEKSGFQVVISYKSNRMARNMLQALAYEDKLSKMGVRVIYAKEEFGDNAAGRFALRTMMNVNQFYSENMAEDITRGLRDSASQCKVVGRLSLGFRKGEDGKYAVDEHGAAVLREIYQRVANDELQASIITDLNARGIKTSSGNAWNKNSFRKLLTNERNTGVYIYDDIRIEGGVPTIIEKELFDAVQKKLAIRTSVRKRRGANADFLLTGKLYCGRCKGHMVGVSGTSKSRESHYYYACNNHLKKMCGKSSVRKDWAERFVAASIKEYIFRDDVTEWIADSVIEYQKKHLEQSRVSYLQNQLSQNGKAIENIIKAIEMGIITETTKQRLLELEGEQVKLRTQIATEKGNIPNVTREQIIFWMESVRDGDVNDKQYQAKLIDSFLIAAFLYDKELKIVFNYTGEANTISFPLVKEAVDFTDSVDYNNRGSECSYKLSLEPPF